MISLDHVIIGKISIPQASGQISQLALSESFAWLKHFSAEELAEFFTELLDALHQGQQAGDWSCVADVLEAWRATANITADPIAMAEVEKGLAELAEGQGVSWKELRQDLGL